MLSISFSFQFSTSLRNLTNKSFPLQFDIPIRRYCKIEDLWDIFLTLFSDKNTVIYWYMSKLTEYSNLVGNSQLETNWKRFSLACQNNNNYCMRKMSVSLLGQVLIFKLWKDILAFSTSSPVFFQQVKGKKALWLCFRAYWKWLLWHIIHEYVNDLLSPEMLTSIIYGPLFQFELFANQFPCQRKSLHEKFRLLASAGDNRKKNS